MEHGGAVTTLDDLPGVLPEGTVEASPKVAAVLPAGAILIGGTALATPRKVSPSATLNAAFAERGRYGRYHRDTAAHGCSYHHTHEHVRTRTDPLRRDTRETETHHPDTRPLHLYPAEPDPARYPTGWNAPAKTPHTTNPTLRCDVEAMARQHAGRSLAAAGRAEDPTHNWPPATPEVIAGDSGSALPLAKGTSEAHMRGAPLHDPLILHASS